MKIMLIDYGVGNIKSVQKAFESLGHDVSCSPDPGDMHRAELVVLPGVGAFGEGMKNLSASEFITPIRDHIQTGKAFLGICLGFQLLFETSDEKGRHEGLGIFPGQVLRFPESELKVPHMGWNRIHVKQSDPVFDSLEDQSFYFVHSYYVDTPDESLIATTTPYGLEFVSSIYRPNLLATQFHPEKSGDAGIRLLRQFLLSIGK